MIRFALKCDREHSFDGWFRNAADYDAQSAAKLVTCPVCGSDTVEKALMAPSVAVSRKSEKLTLTVSEEQRRIMGKLRELAQLVRQNADNVGDRFAEEARKIHFGEIEPRGIYGEATPDEVRQLLDDGVGVMPLPEFPEDKN